ncbi:Uncharacterised protein [Bordetella pertussis]|nr:Uncharacterised protein [Bordetella pertussis]
MSSSVALVLNSAGARPLPSNDANSSLPIMTLATEPAAAAWFS